MHVIETTATVGEERTVTIDHPVDASPGRHRIVLVIDEQGAGPAPEAYEGSAWPPGYFEQTFGALANGASRRGAYEEREALA
jgi:hypothetical protein